MKGRYIATAQEHRIITVNRKVFSKSEEELALLKNMKAENHRAIKSAYGTSAKRHLNIPQLEVPLSKGSF